MESVTCLYNQVEEAVHTLVMKSNQSLQHLEHVLLLRETADSLNAVWHDFPSQYVFYDTSYSHSSKMIHMYLLIKIIQVTL